MYLLCMGISQENLLFLILEPYTQANLYEILAICSSVRGGKIQSSIRRRFKTFANACHDHTNKWKEESKLQNLNSYNNKTFNHQCLTNDTRRHAAIYACLVYRQNRIYKIVTIEARIVWLV